MEQFPLLTTGRLVLREFRPTDAPAVLAIFSQDQVTRYVNVATMHSLDEAVRLVETRASLFRRGLGLRWAITLATSPEAAIGSCGLYNVNRAYRSIEVGYDLHPAHWRQGIMTEALTAMIEFLYGDAFELQLNRIEALTAPQNEASIRLLEKLGFGHEGTRRGYGYWKDRFHDVSSLALLRRDWESRQTRLAGRPGPRIRLTPMTEADYADFLDLAIADYAEGQVRAGAWPAGDALHLSEAAFRSLLPEGLNSPEQYLRVIQDAELDLAVGYLWYGLRDDSTDSFAALYELIILPELRGRGYGRAALRALEAEVTDLGLGRIALHAFGHNAVARTLYRQMGYVETNVTMARLLGAPNPGATLALDGA